MGGMALHEGRLAEMATGEGKTLVAVLPVYLNALSGKNIPYLRLFVSISVLLQYTCFSFYFGCLFRLLLLL